MVSIPNMGHQVRMNLLRSGSEYPISCIQMHYCCPCAPCKGPVTRGHRQPGKGPDDPAGNVSSGEVAMQHSS